LAPGGPVGLKAGGADRWPAMPGPAAAAYVCSCRVRVGPRGPGQDNEADRTEDRWMKG